jgi:hypothetical protein
MCFTLLELPKQKCNNFLLLFIIVQKVNDFLFYFNNRYKHRLQQIKRKKLH